MVFSCFSFQHLVMDLSIFDIYHVQHFRQSQELEALQKKHRTEIEEFMRDNGYSMPSSPLISSTNATQQTVPILSPLNISTIPNPPPLPASMMSLQLRENFPLFTVASNQQNARKVAGSFTEELFKVVESFTARSQAMQMGNEPKTCVSESTSHACFTSTTESNIISTSPRIAMVNMVASTHERNDGGCSSVDSDSENVAQPTGKQTPSAQDFHNSAFLSFPQPVYNLHYPVTTMTVPSHYPGTQIVEAGLLPPYPQVIPVPANVPPQTECNRAKSPNDQ